MRIKLHRELEELPPHLADLSNGATKLYLVLHLKANRQQDTKRGRVEAAPPFDDLVRECSWSLSTLKRAIRELREKSHITVERDEVRSDPDPKTVEVKSDPAKVNEVKSDPTAPAAVNAGVKSDPQESVPDVPDEPSSAAKQFPGIPAGCLFTNELSPASRDLFEFIGFACDRRLLSRGFIKIVEKHAKLRPWHRPGMLASKILTRCLYWQTKRRKEGKDPLLYAWPPGLQKHTAILRRQERLAGKAESARAA